MTTTSLSLKYLFINFSVNSEVAGTNSDNFIIALFPAANISIRGAILNVSGKFHGEMMPTTP